MNLKVDNDYQHKWMLQTFEEPTNLATTTDVLEWRKAWMAALSSWHSPYKAMIDCTNLSVADTPDVRDALLKMVKFFEGFFLRKVVGFGQDDSRGHAALPFAVLPDEEGAYKELGIRERKERVAGDFRSQIILENHFRQHVIELSFASVVYIDDDEKLEILKSKLMNNLMQWHSKWSLIVDCTNVEFSTTTHQNFERMLKVLRGLFMKDIVGYSPMGKKEDYPFEVFRARHRAAAKLEAEGAFSGDEANCRSRSQPG